jgi:hypothetical protein
VLLTWLRLVGGMWVSLTGNVWLINTIGIAAGVAWIPLVFVGVWLYRDPKLVAMLVAALPALAAGAVGLKLVVAAWLARQVSQRCSVPSRMLAVSVAAWAAVAVGFIALSGPVLSREQVPLLGVAAVVVLLMPLNRLLAAPWVLAWSRHR